ncbi:DinB family protein [Luteibaculum oceani]|uniref:DUF1572 domain-containing protein n=1 Tax=Luteibaculum oceani TaxID=1294296 RepID=A0A5C6V9C6_9FLAO|nr:DinB family protein [Luteibaculum oceani]TXC82072.1 DUF1572 domain-containing protein [Luteibaculum oceani]
MLSLLQNEIQLRICEESIPRILHCLDLLSDEEVWFKPNQNCNTVGNLILHLNGNCRQWLLFNLLEIKFQRKRQDEFESRTYSKKDLIEILEGLRSDISANCHRVTEKDLGLEFEIQGINTTGLGIVVHVIEHFSYHTGQIALLTKLIKNQDLGFYGDNTKLDCQ